jgi:hypothetical protein
VDKRKKTRNLAEKITKLRKGKKYLPIFFSSTVLSSSK